MIQHQVPNLAYRHSNLCLSAFSDTWIEFPAMRHRRTEHVMSVDQDDVISIFGGYQAGHLDTIEVYDEGSEWDYLSQYLQEPKSQLAVAIVPAGIIPENC